MADPTRGGVALTAKSWRRTIYLITDGAHAIDKGSIDAIAARIKDDKISLRVIGVDFDDPTYGYKEEDKELTKADNEKFWHRFLSDLPDSRIASAIHALEQVNLPTIQLQTPAPYKTQLTFGDPDRAYTSDTVLSIPVKMFKLTSRVLPMSRKTISKLAEESNTARRHTQTMQEAESDFRAPDGSIIPTPTPQMPDIDQRDKGALSTYEVENRRIHFLSSDVREHGTENAEALEEGAEEMFSKAYKLGSSLIPLGEVPEEVQPTEMGLEIMHWVKQGTFRRQYLMGEVWNIFADEANPEAQLKMSSISKAMRQQEKLALVRFVRRQNADPKIGILYPVDRDQGEIAAEYFHFAEVPFSEDLKRYTFPSLDRVLTADGKELKEHRTLATEKMVDAMSGLIDSMDLSRAFKDEEGQEQSWFSTEDSFNPAIHRMKEAVAWRLLHPESTKIPRPHWEVDKFLARPQEIEEASAAQAQACRNLFNIRYYPEKAIVRANVKRARDAERKAAAEDKTRELDLAEAGDLSEGTNGHLSKVDPSGTHHELKSFMTGTQIPEEDDTDDEEMLGPVRPKSEPLSQRLPPLDTARASPRAHGSDDGEDMEQGPSIRILKDDPVGSLEMHLNNPRLDQGEILRALQQRIADLVSEGDEQSHARAVRALEAGRRAAAEYDEAEEWNEFLRDFKDHCQGGSKKPKNTSAGGDDGDRNALRYLASHLNTAQAQTFWNDRISGVPTLSLITAAEDEGRRSKVTSAEASAFVGL